MSFLLFTIFRVQFAQLDQANSFVVALVLTPAHSTQHTLGEFGSDGDQVQCSRPTMGSMASGPMWRSNWPRSIARLSAKGREGTKEFRSSQHSQHSQLEFLQLYVTRM